ncbi:MULTISPECIES: glycine cleavage system protein GcvH [unclassified Brevibacterium]|uniref:glycine cleavage system protein GcvH n=1 Tax=unclassified Brevibacterium TaxID=2614124 RepID=UPI0008A33885|nr:MULTISPECIES: glycine cleavage system protein GcvH [unclassified Brevibacterium]OFL67837.1 glycine cleavage system protein H [Brevibacterium sp. HMSC063G07]OFS27497.1 glycine cleavage system protein H [Brevibacterium sp. HMSC07C04]
MAELPPLPENFSYSAEHEWINATGDDIVGNTVRIGITAVAADALGEVVFADLPEVGDTVTAGEVCGEVESTKSVSDLYCPVSGEVTAVNADVDDNPSLLNSDPYGEGWLIEVSVTEVGDIMDAAAYGEANHV